MIPESQKSTAVDVSVFGAAMPKEEIGALEFLREHPEYDGRGVVVAIFDTGVDPGAAGFQITTDDKPKIIDVVDCSGSGDVDTSEIVEADADGIIKGRTGKRLRVNPNWKNPTGKWHVGFKRIYEMMPEGAVKRLQDQRLESMKDPNNAAKSEAITAVAKFEHRNQAPFSEDQELMKEELDARVELLQELETKYKEAREVESKYKGEQRHKNDHMSAIEHYRDPGPVVDCVVWHDGEHWRAALDTVEIETAQGKGVLADFVPLTNFKVERQFATFSAFDACNYVCNIYEEGNLLSIVTTSDEHGTHVAGITAGNFPDDPLMNGIAPGAQIVSCKVSDKRVQQTETGSGVVRAVINAIQNKVDLINYSFGGPSGQPNDGPQQYLFDEVVNKHRIIWVASAGNKGAILTSVSYPGVADPILSVGAYLTPKLAAAGHSARKDLSEGIPYNFTSRGPAADGALGCAIAAPGGAIASVPQWAVAKKRMLNGTSMASPSACGGIALLLSGLKVQGYSITPTRIRRAVENTAAALGDGEAESVLATGMGLLQVEKAWDYLQKSEEVDKPDVRYCVQVYRDDGPPQRGIYLREPKDVNNRISYTVYVKPKFQEDADVRMEKYELEKKLYLESTKPWVTCPELLILMADQRDFEVGVDPTSLMEGVHYAEVRAYDAEARWRGPLFRVPVTVTRPIQVEINEATEVGDSGRYDLNLGTLKFSEGREIRRFLVVPDEANWVEITLTAGQFSGSRYYIIQAQQLATDRFPNMFKTGEWLTATCVFKKSLKLVPGATMELSIAQYWNSVGASDLTVDVSFHGVKVREGSELHINGSSGNKVIEVSAPLRKEILKPHAELFALRLPLAPTEAKLGQFSDSRDTLPKNRVVCKLTLKYTLQIAEDNVFRVLPTLPFLSKPEYEADVNEVLIMLTDENKRLIPLHSGNLEYTLTTENHGPRAVLGKGEYTFRVQIRHESNAVLKRLQDMKLVVDINLNEEIDVPVYSALRESVMGSGKPLEWTVLYPGERKTLVLGPLSDELPKQCTPGSVLIGQLKLGQMQKLHGEAPGYVDLTYTVPPKSLLNGTDDDTHEEMDSLTEYKDSIINAKIEGIENFKIKTPENWEEYTDILSQLKAEHGGHLPLLSAALAKLEALSNEERQARLQDIVAAADDVIKAIDKTELACFLAEKCPPCGKGGKRRKRKMNKKKEALVNAVAGKLCALLDIDITTDKKPEAHRTEYGYGDEIEKTFAELRKWVDTTEDAYALLHARHEARNGRHALAAKALNKLLESKKARPTKEAHELRVQCFKALGWTTWEANARAQLNVFFPDDYPVF